METFIVALTVIAFVSSAYFCITWGWAISRASRRYRVSLLGVLDFAGLQAMVLLFTGLGLVSILTDGIEPTEDPVRMFRRTVLYTLLVAVTLLRTFRWLKYRRPRWAVPLLDAYERARAAGVARRWKKRRGLVS